MLDDTTFSDSYERIFGDQIQIGGAGKDFYDYFYQRFLTSHPAVAEAFRNTDMERQKQLLRKSLLYSISFMTNKNNFHSMERIAKLHSKQHYNIQPELYDYWMNSIVDAVKKFDPQFNDDVELAWRLAFTPGITYMKFMYNK